MNPVDSGTRFVGSQGRRHERSSVTEDTWHELEGEWHRVMGWSRDDGGGLLEITACGWLLPVHDESDAIGAEVEVCERCRR